MKKFSKYFFGFAAAAMMFSCSSDEPAIGGGDNLEGGNDLYMNIKIKNAQGSLLGKGTAGGYEFGDSKLGENNISSAHFYFYDAQGNFLVESRLGALNGKPGSPNPGNVELITESAIVLQGLKEDELPAYMITVLNAPEGFNPGTTMAATAAAASSIKSNDDFVMSTSSFFNGNATLYDNNYPYANRLTANNFKKTKAEALETGVPVEVYVERLAAKFEITGVDDEGFREVRVTVAGNDNGDISGEDYPEAGTKMYVKFDKWGVTNTELESNMCKNILGTGVNGWSYSSNATTINNFNWNISGDYRSYWGASRSYGQANPTLNHLTHATVSAPISSPVYCNETTNTKDNTSIAAGTVNINNVTCVLLTATLYEEVDGVKKPVEDMVLYRGVYYKYDQFIKYLLQNVQDKQPNKELNFYICDDATKPVGERTFTQVSADDMVLYQPEKPAVTGAVRVKLNSDETVLYARSTEDGKDKYTEIKDGTEALKKVLDTFFSMGDNNGEYQAIGYKGGAMFYTVPVEHLIAKNENSVKYAVDFEGNYGVVRNHVYKINVNSVTKIGHGIFTPGEGGEELIPENPNDDRFNLGAVINVLSWKVVSQDVDL